MIGAWVFISAMCVLHIQELEPASDRIEFEEIVQRSPVVLSVAPEISRIELRFG